MILKISHQLNDEEHRWWYAEVKELSNNIQALEITTEENWKQWLNSTNKILLSDGAYRDGKFIGKEFYYLEYIDYDDNHKTVIYDQIAYLLNDKGETVDRLNSLPLIPK